MKLSEIFFSENFSSITDTYNLNFFFDIFIF